MKLLENSLYAYSYAVVLGEAVSGRRAVNKPGWLEFFLFLFLRTFTIHRIVGKGGGGSLCNSFLPLPAASQALTH